jgi:Fe-S-cluster-containing dehydrogenase component
MLANYGYKDGSGEYFITIDTEKCNGCGACVEACPYGVMRIGPDENDPFREEPVASVEEEHRKKIKYTCAPCKPTTGERKLPCIEVCSQKAITHSW